jgi:hypothetical protein
MATLSKKFVVLGAAALVGTVLATMASNDAPDITVEAGAYQDNINAAAAVTTEGDKVMDAVYSPASP